MTAQEIADGEVLLQIRQHRMKLVITQVLPPLTRQRRAVEAPLRAVDGLQRQSGLADQGTRDRRFAMDEFGAALGGIAELRHGQLVDAATASRAGFEDGHTPSGARQLARRHQPGRTRTHDDDMFRLSRHR